MWHYRMLLASMDVGVESGPTDASTRFRVDGVQCGFHDDGELPTDGWRSRPFGTFRYCIPLTYSLSTSGSCLRLPRSSAFSSRPMACHSSSDVGGGMERYGSPRLATSSCSHSLRSLGIPPNSKGELGGIPLSSCWLCLCAMRLGKHRSREFCTGCD
jgi:hypothetical protein